MKLGIIFGGKSGEHSISIMSAQAITDMVNKEKHEIFLFYIDEAGTWFKIHQLDKNKRYNSLKGIESKEFLDINSLSEKIDFAFIALHGTYGEDGKVQGLLEMLDIPYSGCGVLASAVAMDKALAKEVFKTHNIPITNGRLLLKKDLNEDEKIESESEESIRKMGLPLFIKPANAGSSLGITKAHDKKELIEGIKLAFQYDNRILVEEYIDGREIEIGIIGNEEVELSSVGEIISGDEFYDFEAKYDDDKGTKLIIPADVSEEKEKEIRSIANKAYSAIDGSGFARADFFIDRNNGKVYLNEINTIPGFTHYSMFPNLWKDAGVDSEELIERIINYGIKRYNDKNKR